MKLIDKINEHKETIAVLRDAEKQGSLVFTFLSHYLLGLQAAIDIVNEHNDWVSVDERLPYAEEMLTNHYNPKEFYEIILKTGDLLLTSFTHMKNDGNNKTLFLSCAIALTDGKWELLDDWYSVYEVDEVAYWKPFQTPRGVKL